MKKGLLSKISSACLLFVMFFITSTISLNAYGFGFTRNDEHKTPNIGFYQEILDSTSSYYVGDTNKKEIYLTFDSGYDNGELPKILDILKEEEVLASFFITGDFVKRFPDLVIRMTNEGHTICNHTYHHPDLTKLSSDEIAYELRKLEDEYFFLTKSRMASYVRTPEGSFDKKTLKVIESLGYKTVFWSSAIVDWKVNGQKGKDYAKKMFLDNLHNGAIILMHSVSSSNREALPSIIREVKSMGYDFKTVSSL